MLTKVTNHKRGKHWHTPIPNPFLQLATPFCQDSTNKPCLTHSWGTARKMPSTEAKAQTNLSLPAEVTNAGPTCPPALSKGFPLLYWKHRLAASAFSSCWVKIQRKEGRPHGAKSLSVFLINSPRIKAVSNPSLFRTPPPVFLLLTQRSHQARALPGTSCLQSNVKGHLSLHAWSFGSVL